MYTFLLMLLKLFLAFTIIFILFIVSIFVIWGCIEQFFYVKKQPKYAFYQEENKTSKTVSKKKSIATNKHNSIKPIAPANTDNFCKGLIFDNSTGIAYYWYEGLPEWKEIMINKDKSYSVNDKILFFQRIDNGIIYYKIIPSNHIGVVKFR